MSEPKPIWNLTVQDTEGNVLHSGQVPEIKIEYDWNLPPPSNSIFNGWRTTQMDRIALAFDVPPEMLRPHIGTIERAERELVRAEILGFQQTLADALLPFIQAFDDGEMRRLLAASEQIRMKMIGRRYQAIFAVLVVLVYLIVEMVTK